jgi:hypothetical protein
VAVDSVDPITGAPQFSDAGAPDTGVDPTEVAKYAADVGNRIVRANLAALNAYTWKRAGLRGVALDTGIEYAHNGSGWVATEARLSGRVNRSATATTFPSSGYTNVSANTFWTASSTSGFAAYDNGWVIPASGRYSVSYEIRAAASFLSGVSVNYSGASPTLMLASSPAGIQGVASATVSATLPLLAGDVLRLYLLANSGTPAWITSVGFFSVEWVGSD